MKLAGDCWGMIFDRVLVDAPCSSDRHFAAEWAASATRGHATGVEGGKGGPGHRKPKPRARKAVASDGGSFGGVWSKGRLKRDAQYQLLLVRRAVSLLKPGGRLVYSTCSIDPQQNDGVIQKLLDKVSYLRLLDPLGELQGAGVDELVDRVERTK